MAKPQPEGAQAQKPRTSQELLDAVALAAPGSSVEAHRLMGALYLVDHDAYGGEPRHVAEWLRAWREKNPMGWPALLAAHATLVSLYLDFSAHPKKMTGDDLRAIAAAFPERRLTGETA